MRHQSDMIVKIPNGCLYRCRRCGRYFGQRSAARSNEAICVNEHQIQLDTAEREKRELLLKNLSAQTAKDLQYKKQIVRKI